MKKVIVLLLLPLCFHANAQESEGAQFKPKTGFQKQKLFTGGSANIGFSSGSTMLGITPQLGYSLTNWLDAGITFNLNYLSQKDYYSGDKLRQTTYGPGAFVRLFPVNFLFASAQYEYNSMHLKYIPNVAGSPSQINTQNANSFLVGAGYAGGRMRGGNTYYYLSIMWDISGDPNSPYHDQYGRTSPVIRAGYNIGLFQNRNKRDYR
ncbi:MAG: hypothetical protein KGM16_15350 [Bacteroidota bacterium]|jgi:hypothetical protein|nr:hypothetical protein [Bacteroidota bacterium]